MLGFQFSKHNAKEETPFEKLFGIFKELLLHTNGDVDEAFDWLNELDKQYGLTTNEYTLEDFKNDLKKKGFIKDDKQNGGISITSKTEQEIRKQALDQIFGKLKKSGLGNHKTPFIGKGNEISSDKREYQFGDLPEQIAITDSIKNAQINNGTDNFILTEKDLEINESEHKTQTSTVLMIDISHSMILYGEDRITPAKKVALALAELIKTKYPKDTLDIIVFGNDAWPITLKDLPYLQVGPYHTNTVAGLELAMDILKRKKTSNKQIFMITDGKPSCIIENGEYYMNSNGLDRKIVNRTLNAAHACRRLKIPITTFMIARDNYLMQFIEEFTEANQGKAFYTSLKGLGEFIFHDYTTNRRKNIK
ncbi:MAG: VWA domain-containing protein [Bacteroidota bacterium]